MVEGGGLQIRLAKASSWVRILPLTLVRDKTMYVFLACIVILAFISLNQYKRMKRLEWYSDTTAFYEGFGYLLFYVLVLGIVIGSLI